MDPVGQTICLCMIVKNEAPVIWRCLKSVRGIIDHWVIVDTGSTDGTQQIIRDFMADIPGTLYEREWRDFAHNRSEALALARPHANYSFIIDADDACLLTDEFQMPVLQHDSYTVDIDDPPLRYQRNQLVNNRLAWEYRGVLHEFLACDAPHTTGFLPLLMRRNHDGARRRDSRTYTRDADILAKALKTETDPHLRARYTFYLAQSYRDAEQPLDAIRHYLERATMGGWEEEIYVSLYQVAKLKEQLGHPDDEVIAAYEAAAAVSDTRVEALHGASRLCRLRERYSQGYEIAKRGLGRTEPGEALFSEPWIYHTGLLDEFAVNASWIGHYRECHEACLKIIATGRLEGEELHRVVANAALCFEQVSKVPAA